jgi:hypothetical protein
MKEVRTTVAILGVIAAIAILAISCAQEEEQPAIVTTGDFFLPVGDVAAGRQAFVDLKCYSCHAVPDDPDMPPPDGDVNGPECGGELASKSREYIADYRRWNLRWTA